MTVKASKILYDLVVTIFTLTEAEDIKKRWQEYTEELYKKIFMTQIITTVWSLTESQTPGMWSQVGLRKHHYEQS